MGDHPALDYHEAQHGNWFATITASPKIENPQEMFTTKRIISSMVIIILTKCSKGFRKVLKRCESDVAV